MDWISYRKMLSRITVFIIAIVFIFSLSIANILDIIRTDSNNQSVDRDKRNSQLIDSDSITINHQLKHTFWFMQISDIHLSIYFDRNRERDLLKFCTQYIDIIKPSVVLATGDLTDARSRDPMGSTQQHKEWIMYSNILNKSDIRTKTNWLDIKGNHDNFNVLNWESDTNYFKKYSIRGPNNKRSYKFSLKHETETYSFIGVDACLSPGPKGLFNFIGLLKDKDMDAIKQLKRETIEEKSNYTLWFGHYPTSSIATPNPGLRDIINGPYFCGHFHTVFGLIHKMYSTQPNGYLELELADWKDLRKLRLAAVDHGLFTFTDFTLNEWPIILITNPKPSLYSMPHLEPYHRIAKSTHIRALIFSKSNISSVEFKIDDNEWIAMKHISGPLYVHEWNPKNYSSGLHWIHVSANDIDHNQRSVKQQFSLDDSKPDFSFWGTFMIRYHIQSVVGFWLFGLSVTTCVLPLLMLRSLELCKKGKFIYASAERDIIRRLIFKFYLLSNVNKIFIPLIAIPIYASIGPWFVGYVIDSHIGICFVWGMIVDGSYLPGGFTYMMGALFLLLFQMPMTCCLAHIVYCRHKQLLTISDTDTSFIKTYCHIRNFLWLFFIICHIYYSKSFYFAYGLISYIFGFLNTWSIIIYTILWKFSLHLNPISFPESIRPKSSKRKRDIDKSNDNEDSSLNLPLNKNKNN